jgi:hypothetical protein
LFRLKLIKNYGFNSNVGLLLSFNAIIAAALIVL